MMYWDGNMGVRGFILMGVSFVLVWGAVITAIILLARSMGAGNQRRDGCPELPRTLLSGRFACGEIDESEYTARLAVLRRGGRG